MNPLLPLPSLVLLLLQLLFFANKACAELYLNMTVITGNNDISVLKCWQLTTPFATSDVPGVVGTQTLGLGPLVGGGSATYTILPPRFDGGLHNAPVKQYVWFITGLVHLSLPNVTDEAWVYGGKYGLIFADDTVDVSRWGHITKYPGADETVASTIPTENGTRPDHVVLHDGACEPGELSGI